MVEIASTHKVIYHKEKIKAYLRDEVIFPVTLELDITSACNRKCQDCPSTTTLRNHYLKIGFIERLFSGLEGQTRGLLLTGGEPTLAPAFPDVLRLAEKHGFTEVAVVTNGSFLDKEQIVYSLLEHASIVRVSLYDWHDENGCNLHPVFKNIEFIRSQIDQKNNKLQIGISVLTSRDNIKTFEAVVDGAQSAGAHWIYFHPTCINWDQGKPFRVNQKGVLNKIKEIQNKKRNDFKVLVYDDRYLDTDIFFNGYHAANFLLVIGADGINYLGAEVKYQPQYRIWDLNKDWRDDFLWDNKRLELIKSINSQNYLPIKSRHRGVLYNDFINRLKKDSQESCDTSRIALNEKIITPHIL